MFYDFIYLILNDVCPTEILVCIIQVKHQQKDLRRLNYSLRINLCTVQTNNNDEMQTQSGGSEL